MSFFGNFFEKGKLRAEGARAQVRARKFGARHRIENQKSYILCIYNILISLKVAEIERLEILSLDAHLAHNPGKNKVPPLSNYKINVWDFFLRVKSPVQFFYGNN